MEGAKTVIFAATGNNYAGTGSSYDVDYLVRPTALRASLSRTARPHSGAVRRLVGFSGERRLVDSPQGVGVCAEAAKAAGVQKLVLCSCAFVTGARAAGAIAASSRAPPYGPPSPASVPTAALLTHADVTTARLPPRLQSSTRSR